MKVNRKVSILYIITDFIGSSLAWALFYLFRKCFIENNFFSDSFHLELGNKFYYGILVIPMFWIALYSICGFYANSLHRSRLHEFGKSFLITLIGAVILFFTLLLNDTIKDYSSYYILFLVLLSLEFLLTWGPRFIITSWVTNRIHHGIIGFNTLIIGSNGKATEICRSIKEEKKPAGNLLTGYLNVTGRENEELSKLLPYLGTLSDLEKIVTENKIEEVVIAIEGIEYDVLNEVVNRLCHRDIIIKAAPSMYDILSGRIETASIYATPLIRISRRIMPYWQYSIKVITDYVCSSLALVLLSPIMAVLAIAIKIEDKGPVFFTQERIGRHGKIFRIIKFRSMTVNAENGTPMLATEGDKRVTRVGRLMRKHRLDEIPNFLNVLKGDMSLVGPRPERRHFIDLIIEKAPYYNRVLAIKPGITCWGQIKLGYANDIDQMLRRLEYDLAYLENISLYLDVKIIFYTFGTIIGGRGL